VHDAFRRSLGYAIQWHDSLRLRMLREVDAAIEAADKIVQDTTAIRISTPAAPVEQPAAPIELTTAPIDPPAAPDVPPSVQGSTAPGPSEPSSGPRLSPGQCARVLQQRCPACFGGTMFGRTFDE
jgi:hypothetical protein